MCNIYYPYFCFQQEMINESKSTHSGLKLEVNGKILDSCTDLMKAIRLLVQKARILQEEIVASGNQVQLLIYVLCELIFSNINRMCD